MFFHMNFIMLYNFCSGSSFQKCNFLVHFSRGKSREKIQGVFIFTGDMYARVDTYAHASLCPWPEKLGVALSATPPPTRKCLGAAIPFLGAAAPLRHMVILTPVFVIQTMAQTKGLWKNNPTIRHYGSLTRPSVIISCFSVLNTYRGSGNILRLGVTCGAQHHK